MPISSGMNEYRLAFEISPIYLTRGLAGTLPGGTVPLISYTEQNTNLLTVDTVQSLDNYFAHFMPVPGSLLENNAVGQYPFANQSVAANAIIFEPLAISMLMICPVNTSGGYRNRSAILTSLKKTLRAHNLAGGTYSVATPAYLYVDCILLRVTDASAGETRQAQYRYQFDFIQPLVTEEDAKQSYNNLMAKIGSQTQLSTDANGKVNWSGQGNTVGNPSSGVAPSVIPGTQTDPGAGFAPSGNLVPGGMQQNGGVGFPGFSTVPFGSVSVGGSSESSQTRSASAADEQQNTALVDIPSGDF